MKGLRRRHILQSWFSIPLIGISGVTAYGKLDDRPSVVRKSKTGNKRWKLVDCQPDLDEGPGTLWAYLIDSEEADENVHWERWPTNESNPAPRVSDFSEHVIVVVVGIVKPGYELDELAEPTFEQDNVTHTYTISETKGKFRNAADRSYHYDLIRWELTGNPAPRDVELEVE